MTREQNSPIFPLKEEQTPTIDVNVYKARFEYLNGKKNLTAQEKHELEILTTINKATGGNFDLMGEYCTDAENSTIALMQKDEQFLKEAKIDRKQAEENWLKAQFKDLDLNNEEDFAEIKDRMSKLWNNCASPEEKLLLAGIVKRTTGKYFKQIHDDYEAVWKNVDAALNGDSEDQIETTRQLGEAFREKRISEETIENMTSAAPEIFKEEVLADVFICLNESGSEEVTKATIEAMESKDFPQAVIDSFFMGKDYLHNENISEEQKRSFSKKSHLVSRDKQVDCLKSASEYYAKNQDVTGMNATAESIRYCAAENQAPAAETHFNATLELENPEDRENAQSTLTDQIVYFDASAQAEAHRIVCQSEFESVLTKAAGNICKYDESAQKDALKYTLDTENGNAIKAAVETAKDHNYSVISQSSKNYDSDLDKVITRLHTIILAYETDKNEDNRNKYSNYLNSLADSEDSPVSCSDDEKELTSEEEFYEKLEKVATAYNKYQLIKNSNNKKQKLKKLIKSNEEILTELLRMGFGEELMSILGKNSKYGEKIARLMKILNQDYELQTLATQDNDFKEMLVDNNSPGSAQTVHIGYTISDFEYLLKDNNLGTDYLVA